MAVALKRLLAQRPAAVAALILVLVQLVRRLRRRKPSCPAVPGHWLLSNLPELLRRTFKNTHLEMFTGHHTLLGRTICYEMPGKPFVIDTTCPKNVEHMLKTNFNNYEKGSWFRVPLTELLGDGIFNADGALWHSQRKTASRMFTAQLFKDHIWHVVAKNSEKVRSILEQSADNAKNIDIFNLMNRFTLDTIGEIGFGADIGSLDDPSSPFLASFDHAQKSSYFRFFFPSPLWRLMRLLGIGTERGSRRHFELLDGYSLKVVRDLAKQAQEKSSAGPSFVGLFLQDALSRGEKPSEKFLRDLVLNFLIAGRDTTAQALSWTIFCIKGDPRVEGLLTKELADVLQAGSKDGSSKELSYDQIGKLPYLQAVVNEALRLYPSVPTDSKVAISDDELPDGTFVPRGTVVEFNPYAMARDCDLWGVDAGEFRPERWLELQEPPSPYKFPVFNAGPRECLGKRLAYLEMKAVLAQVFTSVSLELAIARDEVMPQSSITIGMSSGLPCTVRRRSQEVLNSESRAAGS
eukprot:TRINITY_DN29920_c0_g1_i1.p1 TRINITY_DN29920_c0_g1~~TRINITY_DN29920_c0_g1_i1.p1  ORF type:complete len:520 (+),score=105.26 TRINITY_DN29920_c0_g1_i1:87-1646(+)